MTSGRSVGFVRAWKLGLVAACAFLIGGTPPLASACGAENTPAENPVEKPFLAENDTAMNKMMSDMTIRPLGDVDHDFVAMMVPHHQGAVDMAQAELRYGHNEQLRRIAQEIIVDQLQEITAMRLALGQPLPASALSPTQRSPMTPTSEEGGASGSTICRAPR
jgi:DUF305 family protein family protein